MSKPLNLPAVLAEGGARLTAGSPAALIESPSLDAALLLAEALALRREELYLRSTPLSLAELERYREFLERRLSGECTAYILGRRDFWSLSFTVTPDVLVPRPDTEILVEAALENLSSGRRLLDLCTGSGAVAIALKHECPAAKVWASDISEKALAVARRNAAALAGGDICFCRGDLFSALESGAGAFDVITANAPYIPSAQIPALAPEVRFEPALALDGGTDGLDLIRRIIAGSPLHLAQAGRLFLEADPRQMPEIRRLLKAQGFQDIVSRQDLAGRDRVISGTFSGPLSGGSE